MTVIDDIVDIETILGKDIWDISFLDETFKDIVLVILL